MKSNHLDVVINIRVLSCSDFKFKTYKSAESLIYRLKFLNIFHKFLNFYENLRYKVKPPKGTVLLLLLFIVFFLS